MPRLTYSPTEGHRLLTAAETAASAGQHELAGVYDALAVEGIDLDACLDDDALRDRLGMPPLAGADDQDEQAEHPHVA